MIHIQRPRREPPELAKQRRAGLSRAFAALNAPRARRDELLKKLTGYDGGKAKLFKAQHRKCAYCERRVGLVANVIDHVRPKREAWRNHPSAPKLAEPGYWWLTWTWTNHLFACSSCNTGHKSCYYPLTTPTVLGGPVAPYRYKRLRPEHLDMSVESPLLIDPAGEDPLDHIEWRPVDRRRPKKLWKWSPAHLTPRGEWTIAVLGLRLLADDIGDHVRDHVLARAESVCAHVDAGRYTAARAEWSALGRDVARSASEHAGATWNALHFLVELHRRRLARLPDLPRP